MRRRSVAALLAVALAVVAAFPAAAAPRSEGFGLVRLLEGVFAWFWGPGPAAPLESVVLAAGGGHEPSGGTAALESAVLAEGGGLDPSGGAAPATPPPRPSSTSSSEPDPDR